MSSTKMSRTFGFSAAEVWCGDGTAQKQNRCAETIIRLFHRIRFSAIRATLRDRPSLRATTQKYLNLMDPSMQTPHPDRSSSCRDVCACDVTSSAGNGYSVNACA